jgi:hypothetical protein
MTSLPIMPNVGSMRGQVGTVTHTAYQDCGGAAIFEALRTPVISPLCGVPRV